MRAFDVNKDWHLSVKDLFEALGGARKQWTILKISLL